MNAVQITMYLNESDPWRKLLDMLRRENVAGASVFHAVGGFLGRSPVHVSGLVEAGGQLPAVLIFVDTVAHVERVLPLLREGAPGRLIVSETVTIEHGNLE